MKVQEVTRNETGTYSVADTYFVRERYLDSGDVAGIVDSPQHEKLLREQKIKGCTPTTKFSLVTLKSGGTLTLLGESDALYVKFNSKNGKQLLND